MAHKANATSFKPGNTFWKLAQKAGRPEIWTSKDADELIIKLYEWGEKEDSICMAGFRSENGLTQNILTHLKLKFPDFSQAYELTRMKVANRLALNVGKNIHHAHYNKYQSVYDSELKEHEKEMLLVRAQVEEEARRASCEESNKAHEEVLNQIKELQKSHSSRKMDTTYSIKI